MKTTLFYACLCLLGPVLGAPQACQNQGLQWAMFNNTAGSNVDATYSTFAPAAYKGKKPVYQATSTYVGGNYLANIGSDHMMSIYGSPKIFSVTKFVVNHQGYVVAPAAGRYTFKAQTVDDIALMWFGNKARSTWTRANADCSANLKGPNGQLGSCQYTVTLAKGQFLPFRILYGEDIGGAAAFITFSAPNGDVLLDNTSQSKSIIQYGCGANLQKAPKFPAW